MNITLNGEQRQVPEGVTVLGLLEFLQIQHQRVAVERNEEIVKKATYAGTVISEGDRLEVVSFMGGGSSLRNVNFGMRNKKARQNRSENK
jgi:thiamine biosynthesis protein ThiS